MRTALLLLILGLGSCGGCCKCPPRPDMAHPVDLTAPADLASPTDLSEILDLTADPDLAVCITCDAVINPCPPLGLYCNPATRCCDSTPHLGGRTHE